MRAPTRPGVQQGSKIRGGGGSNAARHRCPAAPSDPPKSGGAAAPPAPSLPTPLETIHSTLDFCPDQP